MKCCVKTCFHRTEKHKKDKGITFHSTPLMMSRLEPETWSCCPADVLLIIFSKLDIDSLVQCYSVNRWWRDMVDYWAQHEDQWRYLASHLMANNGNTFIRKSLLGWRDLYFNYRLWHHIDKAELKYDSRMSFEGISYLHIYKDLLTVMHREGWWETKMTMLKLTEQGFQPAEKIEGPCTNLVQAIINAGPYKRIAFPLKPPLDEESYFYTLTKDNIVEFKFWVHDIHGKKLDGESVCTYYGSDESLDDFVLVERGGFSVILFYMKKGTVIFQDTHRIGRSRRSTSGSEPFNRPHYAMNAEKIFRPIASAHLHFDSAYDFPFTRERKPKLELSNDEDNAGIMHHAWSDDESLSESDDTMEDDHFPISIPDEAENLEAECSTVYRSGKRFVGLSLDMAKHPSYCIAAIFRMESDSADSDDNNSDETERKAKGAEKEKFIAKCVRWVGRDPNLSCATQHGDMLLLGYLDGKIEIHLINFEVVADTSPPKLVFNIQDYVSKQEGDNYTPESPDYKVVVIEVYEMQESHCLLIATALNLYRFVVTYPEHVRNLVGESLEVFSK